MGLWSSLRSVIGLKEYSDDDEAYKVVQSDKNPNREVWYPYILLQLSVVLYELSIWDT